MSKPRIGQEIRYTDEGAEAYFFSNCHTVPPHDGVLGTVTHFTNGGKICHVKDPDGEENHFIWKFHDGMNRYFTWRGKDQ